MDISDLYALFIKQQQVTTDSRNIQPGSIFFALKGPYFDGNQFIQQALEKGAAYCISDNPIQEPHPQIILVADALETLQALAKFHRQQFKIPVIAITGSNGKTTTKELVHAVLSTTFKTYTTKGNLNNHIGVPLTLLSIKQDAQMAVIEMGANHQKEIASYCSYTLPTHGLITNCGKAHLEGFGGVEGVKKGKGELFDYLRQQPSIAFVCSDYDYLQEMSKGIAQIITYGFQNAMHTGKTNSSVSFLSVLLENEKKIHTHLVGDYNFPNVMAAVAIGRTFKISDEKIIAAIENYIPSNSRSQMMEKEGNHYILDAYNANPSSMKAAIENFAKMNGQKKVLIVGAMKELGIESEAEHTAILETIQNYHWQKVIVVGKEFKNVPPMFLHLSDADAVKDWLYQQQLFDHIILVKGSRSMQLEKIVQ